MNVFLQNHNSTMLQNTPCLQESSRENMAQGGYREERRKRHPSHVLCPGSLSWGPIGTEQAENEEFPQVSAGSPAAERGWASQLLGVPPRPFSAEMTTPSTLTPYPKG